MCWAIFLRFVGCVMSFFLKPKPLESNGIFYSLIKSMIPLAGKECWIGFLLSRAYSIISSATDRFWPTFSSYLSLNFSQILLLVLNIISSSHSSSTKKRVHNKPHSDSKLHTHYEVVQKNRKKERKPEIFFPYWSCICLCTNTNNSQES